MAMNRSARCFRIPSRRIAPRLVAFFAIAIEAAAAAGSAPFSTFLEENVTVQGIGHDAAGDIFVAGTVNPSPIPGHAWDVVVARLNPGATKIAYFVYLGAGSGVSTLRALAVDPQGNAYLAGDTTSADFPATFGVPVPQGG